LQNRSGSLPAVPTIGRNPSGHQEKQQVNMPSDHSAGAPAGSSVDFEKSVPTISSNVN
jgi:hypothetical protein